MSVRTLVVDRTRNAKLGNAAATYRTQASCPSTCPLYGSGCYARGRIFGIPDKLGTEDPGGYAAVRALAGTLPDGGMVRANVSGDVLAEDGTPDAPYLAALSALAADRPDADIYTYTHAWRDLPADPAPGVTVNASCETAEDIERAAAAGWPTTVVDPGGPNSLIGQTIAGRRVVQCPAQTGDTTCSDCRLCARPRRRSTVAFTVHGSGSRQAATAVTARRS
jgi:hypothetical protein